MPAFPNPLPCVSSSCDHDDAHCGTCHQPNGDGDFITPAAVQKVREATKDRVNFYMVEEILREHPHAVK